MQDPIYVKKIQEADAALARKLDSDGSLTVSREEIKKILIEKMLDAFAKNGGASKGQGGGKGKGGKGKGGR
jgi:hypothetical protein